MRGIVRGIGMDQKVCEVRVQALGVDQKVCGAGEGTSFRSGPKCVWGRGQVLGMDRKVCGGGDKF